MKKVFPILSMVLGATIGLSACSKSADQNATATENVSNAADLDTGANLDDVAPNAADPLGGENASNVTL